MLHENIAWPEMGKLTLLPIETFTLQVAKIFSITIDPHYPSMFSDPRREYVH